jgi:DNA-binding transcriptional MerR regulator
MTGITVKEVAERICRPHEDMAAVIDRLRNWTKEGLLQPSGERNPGTGRKRRYSEQTVIDAMILSAFAEWGIPAVKAAQYGSAAHTAFHLGRRAVAEARKRTETVSLMIERATNPHVDTPQVVVQFGSINPARMESAVIINITALLDRIEWYERKERLEQSTRKRREG